MQQLTILILTLVFSFVTSGLLPVIPFPGPLQYCNFNIINYQFTVKTTPVFLKPGRNEFFNPTVLGEWFMMRGENAELWCDSGFVKYPNAKLITLTCHNNDYFINNVDGTIQQLKNFGCKSWPKWSAKKNGTCLDVASKIQVGFDVSPNRWVELYTSCHKSIACENYWVKYKIIPSPNQPSVDSLSFTKVLNLPVCNCDYSYSLLGQNATFVNTFLRCSACALKYIPSPPGNYYLARGHLAAKTDFIYAPQQRATFTYINTAPEWQIVNAIPGNWFNVEKSVRDYIIRYGMPFEVYSGTLGYAKLPDPRSSSNPWPMIFLGGYSRLPLPKIFYKVLIDPYYNNGVVLLVTNTYDYFSYNQLVENDYVLCKGNEDVKNQLTWMTYRTDLKYGYFYACTISNFMKKVPFLNGEFPEITNLL